MGFYQTPANRQPQPHTTYLRCRPLLNAMHAVKYPLYLIGGDAYPLVSNAD